MCESKEKVVFLVPSAVQRKKEDREREREREREKKKIPPGGVVRTKNKKQKT